MGVGTSVSVGSGADVAVETAVTVAVGVGGMLWQPVMTKMADMDRARTGRNRGNGRSERSKWGTPSRSGFGTCDSYRSRLLSLQGGMEHAFPDLNAQIETGECARPAQGQWEILE